MLHSNAEATDDEEQRRYEVHCVDAEGNCDEQDYDARGSDACLYQNYVSWIRKNWSGTGWSSVFGYGCGCNYGFDLDPGCKCWKNGSGYDNETRNV